MRRVALRGIRSHLGRFALSVLAVLLGVAFVAGTFSLRTMLSSTFGDLVETSMVGDAYVRGSEAVGSGEPSGPMGGQQRTRIPLGLVDELGAVDGVDVAIPDITGPIVLVGPDGTAVTSGGGAPSFALALHPDEPAAWVEAGRAPEGPDEVALESATLEASGLAVGDSTSVVLGDGVREVEVVGEVGFGAPVAGATIVFLDVATATAAYAADGTVATVAVHAVDGLDEAEVVRRVEEALATGDVVDPAAVEVRTGEDVRAETRAEIESALGFVSTFLLVFAAIALFVGAFIIANTFQMIVRQRQRELAMLRALGASPSQVLGSILGQAAVVGVLGSALGVGAGVALVAGLRVLFASMGMELSGRIPVDGFTVVVSVLVGTLVSVGAAAVPARRAALTPPVEAMRDEVVVADRASLLRAVAGGLLVVGGVAAVLVAAYAPAGLTVDDPGPPLGAGAGAVVIGLLLLAPTLVPPVLAVLAAPAVAALRPLGGLARGNVTRNPRRTASTSGALMIGMALVGAAAVIAASTQASTRTIVEEEATADFLLQSATLAVPDELVAQVAAIDGVERADALRVGSVTADGEGVTAIGVPPELFGTSLEVEVVEGDLASLSDGRAAVQRQAAEDNGWAVGDELTVTGALGEGDVVVGAVIDSRAVGVPLVLPQEAFAALVPAAEGAVETLFVVAQDGVAPSALRDALTEVSAPYVVVSVMDREEFADELAAQVDQILVILYALLGLSIVIAVLGIVNTLALSIAERTREIGLLRAVGLGRLQLATVVTIESVLTAVLGTVLGVAVGAGLAATLPSVYADEGLSTLVVPWSQLGVVLGLAVAVGVLAAVWPAIRAARMDVLDAVSYE